MGMQDDLHIKHPGMRAHFQRLAEREAAAKAAAKARARARAEIWLASLDESQCPVEDRLIANAMGELMSEDYARGNLYYHLYSLAGYHTADHLAKAMAEQGYSDEKNAFANAVALMQEREVPEQYWQNCQDPFAA